MKVNAAVTLVCYISSRKMGHQERSPKKRIRGQFIPISAIAMFTMAVFLVAVANVYKIARIKLKVQNLADAVALNLASQSAQAYNTLADRNEWMNRMTAGMPSPSDPSAPGGVKDCSIFNMGNPNSFIIPPIACVENNISIDADDGKEVFRRYIFNARGDPRNGGRDGAIGYAMLVHTINRSQQLFVHAYNSFLGAQTGRSGSSSATQGPSNFEGLLKLDIPELANPKIHLVVWNSGDLSLQDAEATAEQNESAFDSTRMRPLKFEVHHDIETRYMTNKGIEATTFGNLLYGSIDYGDDDRKNGPLAGEPFEPVGWMVPSRDQPTIPVKDDSGSSADQVGVGVFVSEDVDMPVLGTLRLGARAKAYVIRGSGAVGDGGGVPVFQPTYWIKLGS
jgi:hypothetical protein